MNLQTLYEHGLSASLDGDKLVITPAAALTDELRTSIRQHKADITEELLRQPHRLWLLHFADRESVICSIIPECDHAEILKINRTACAAEALNELP